MCTFPETCLKFRVIDPFKIRRNYPGYIHANASSDPDGRLSAAAVRAASGGGKVNVREAVTPMPIPPPPPDFDERPASLIESDSLGFPR